MWAKLCLSVLQVAVKNLVVSFYRSTRRPKAIYWFARTALWRHWYKRAARRSTAPESAWSWKKNSAAGESQFSEVCRFPRSGVHTLLLAFCVCDSIYIFWLFVIWSSFFDFPCAPGRAFNFQRHNRKCHLLPFDRFTHGVQKQANINFTLYEKKGKCSLFFFLRLFVHYGIHTDKLFVVRLHESWLAFLSKVFGSSVDIKEPNLLTPCCLITLVERVAA